MEELDAILRCGGGIETTPMIYWSALDWPQPRGIYIIVMVEEERCGEGGGCFNASV
jgi:hypothetical protein